MNVKKNSLEMSISLITNRRKPNDNISIIGSQ